jgi:hypothetical protein
MKNPLKRDTADVLAGARENLAAAARRIEALVQERREALESDADLAAVLAIDRKIEDERRLHGVIGERIAYLEARATDERKAKRERWREAALAVLDAAAAELASMAPPVRWPQYMERERSGVVDMVSQLFARSRRHVADAPAGLDFIRRTNERTALQGGYLHNRMQTLSESVRTVDLDLIYGPDGDYEGMSEAA